MTFHLKALLWSLVAWAVFWLIGWPNYYRQYTDRALVAMVVAAAPFFFAAALWTMAKVMKIRACSRLQASFWVSFYGSAPFLIFDWLYCGVYLGRGVAFFSIYWYLTIYYVLPWIALPPAALAWDRALKKFS